MTVGKINKRKILGLYSPSGVFELKKIYAERKEINVTTIIIYTIYHDDNYFYPWLLFYTLGEASVHSRSL